MYPLFTGGEIGGTKTWAALGNEKGNTLHPYTDEYVLITNEDRYDIISCTFTDTAVLVGAILHAAHKLMHVGSSPR